MELKEFRELKGNDVFFMSRILSKMDLKLDVTEHSTQEQVGADLILQILSNLHMAREDVNTFLGGLIGMDGKDFGELPLETYMAYIEQFKNAEGIANFLTRAGKLMK